MMELFPKDRMKALFPKDLIKELFPKDLMMELFPKGFHEGSAPHTQATCSFPVAG